MDNNDKEALRTNVISACKDGLFYLNILQNNVLAESAKDAIAEEFSTKVFNIITDINMLAAMLNTEASERLDIIKFWLFNTTENTLWDSFSTCLKNWESAVYDDIDIERDDDTLCEIVSYSDAIRDSYTKWANNA